MTAAERRRTVAARITDDLRADLQRIADDDGHGEISVVLRAAAREYADRRLGRSEGPLLEAAAAPPRRRASAPHTNLTSISGPGTQRRRVLELYEYAGVEGLTTDDVLDSLERSATDNGQVRGGPRVLLPAANAIARRVTDLLHGDLITKRLELTRNEHVNDDGTITVTRKTRYGRTAIVYVITGNGTRALEDARTRERHATEAKARKAAA